MALSEISYPNSYNRELILDLTLNAFSVYDFDHENYPRVHDYVQLPGFILTETSTSVYDSSGNVVVDGSGNPVTTLVLVTGNRSTDLRRENFKLLVSESPQFTLGEYKDYTFTDWVSFDGVGVDFSSFLLTGYNLAGDMARQKQVIYLQVFCRRTEDYYDILGNLDHQSSCMVKSEWNWNNSAAQGKWGTSFQAYRFLYPYAATGTTGDAFDYGETVVVTKNKLRGRGKSLSILFESAAGKDLHLYGWNALVTINGEP
jgi:hypothetical protein